MIYDDEYRAVMNYGCKIDGVKVTVDNKNKYNDEYNFCYSREDTALQTGVFIGAIVGDAVLTYFSAGFLTHVGASVGFAAASWASAQYENWP